MGSTSPDRLPNSIARDCFYFFFFLYDDLLLISVDFLNYVPDSIDPRRCDAGTFIVVKIHQFYIIGDGTIFHHGPTRFRGESDEKICMIVVGRLLQ